MLFLPSFSLTFTHYFLSEFPPILECPGPSLHTLICISPPCLLSHLIMLTWQNTVFAKFSSSSKSIELNITRAKTPNWALLLLPDNSTTMPTSFLTFHPFPLICNVPSPYSQPLSFADLFFSEI